MALTRKPARRKVSLWFLLTLPQDRNLWFSARGVWLLVRPQLSRIDVIGNMTVFQTVLESSSLSFCTLLYRSTMVVRLTVNQEVAGSSPADTAFLGRLTLPRS